MRLVLLAFLVSIIGCAPGWARSELGAPSILPAQQHVQVWTADGDQVLHAVTADSLYISGVPLRRSPACDSCRVVLPRATVDSLRLGDATAGIVRGLVTGMVLLTMSQILTGGW